MASRLSSLVVVVVCLLPSMINSQQRVDTFERMTSSTGQEVCAVDNPFEVDWLMPKGLVQCGTRCMSKTWCQAYNFNKQNGKCDKFNNAPKNYTPITGCVSYTAKVRNLRILVQQHINGVRFFDRTWAEFKVGFGDPSDNYWIGNDALHSFTTSGQYRMRFDMQASYNGQWYYAQYDTFQVDTEASGYKLTFSGYSGDAGDALFGNAYVNSNGAMFSTKDRDNDVSPYACARDTCGGCGCGGGWWYRNCAFATLNSASSCQYSFAWRVLPIGSVLETDDENTKLLVSRMTLVPK